MTPRFSLSVAGQGDVTAVIGDRLLSITIKDSEGLDADSAELVMDDRRGAIELPREDVEIEVALGYEETEVMTMGRYVVDEREIKFPPRSLVLRARGIDLLGGLKTQRTRSWRDATLGGVVSDIARSYRLEARVESSLASMPVPRLDQLAESDMNLLMRLGRGYHAVAKPAGGKLLFVPKGLDRSVTGKSMPAPEIAPGDVSQGRCILAGRSKFESVRALWQDFETAMQRVETAGSGEPAYELRELYPDAAVARAAAEAKLATLASRERRLTLSFARGRPEIMCGTRLDLARFGTGMDGSWSVQRATHRLSRKAYLTQIEAHPVQVPA